MPPRPRPRGWTVHAYGQPRSNLLAAGERRAFESLARCPRSRSEPRRIRETTRSPAARSRTSAARFHPAEPAGCRSRPRTARARGCGRATAPSARRQSAGVVDQPAAALSASSFRQVEPRRDRTARRPGCAAGVREACARRAAGTPGAVRSGIRRSRCSRDGDRRRSPPLEPDAVFASRSSQCIRMPVAGAPVAAATLACSSRPLSALCHASMP